MNRIGTVLIILIMIFNAGCSMKKQENQVGSEILESIDTFMNRKIYNDFTKNDLNNIPDDQLEQALIDYACNYIDDMSYEVDRIKSLSDGFQYVYSTWILEGQVYNGGFIQYYYNTSFNLAEEAYHGYLAFGSEDAAEIVHNAIDCINSEYELYENTKEDGSFDSFLALYENSPFGNLDDEFYACSENLCKLRINYIRENIDEFVTK